MSRLKSKFLAGRNPQQRINDLDEVITVLGFLPGKIGRLQVDLLEEAIMLKEELVDRPPPPTKYALRAAKPPKDRTVE